LREVSRSDLAYSLLDLRIVESPSRTLPPEIVPFLVNDGDVITPPRSPQTDEQGFASKTLMLENSQASSLGWIELFLNNWCAPARKP
jgi:hypothetical protein